MDTCLFKHNLIPYGKRLKGIAIGAQMYSCQRKSLMK